MTLITEIGSGRVVGYVENGYHCTLCGTFVPDGTTHYCANSSSTIIPIKPKVKQGWECPKCHSIWSPEVKGCQKCNQ